MRAYEFLLEGQGLRAGKPGEVYSDPNGVEYQFQGWNWEFPAGADAYTDTLDMQADILQQTGQDRNKIIWINPTSSLRAKSFAYAVFKAPDGQEMWIGKFFAKKSPNNTIQDKEVRAAAQLTAGGAAKTVSSAVKASAAVKPQHLGLADGRARSISTIVKAVAQHQQGQMLANALNAAANNQHIIFTGGAGIQSALQDDFCEVLAPVAMIREHAVVKGHLQQALADIFKGDAGNIASATIQFPSEENNPLVDSYIELNGIQMGVSHKGKTGAKATITNIWQAKDEASKTDTGAAYIAKYPEAVAILDICKEESGLTQPVTLALRYKLISATEAQALQSLLENPRDPAQQLVGNPANPIAVVKQVTPEDATKVPPQLKRIFSIGGYKAGSFVGFLCLARVAKIVADYINTAPKIDFGEAIRSFLNSSAMVQAKSAVSVQGQDAVVKSVNVVYPPNFKERAKLESNGYSGTQVKGKFSFSLPST